MSFRDGGSKLGIYRKKNGKKSGGHIMHEDS